MNTISIELDGQTKTFDWGKDLSKDRQETFADEITTVNTLLMHYELTGEVRYQSMAEDFKDYVEHVNIR